MSDVCPLEDYRFRRKFVQIRRAHLYASVTRDRVRSLLVRQEKNQIGLSLCSHGFQVTHYNSLSQSLQSCIQYLLSAKGAVFTGSLGQRPRDLRNPAPALKARLTSGATSIIIRGVHPVACMVLNSANAMSGIEARRT